MDVFETIQSRHSVRRYKPDPIPDDVLVKVLDAARLAPSWSNTQCWRFIVVKDRDSRNKLADTSPGNTGVQAMRDAPIVIVACAELNKAAFRNGKPLTDKEGYWFMFDTALAMQNLVLAARSLGLGTVICGFFDAIKAASIVNLPEGYAVVAMTPLGYPAVETRPNSRKDLSEIVFSEKFGEPLK